jgi:hypothetical protein
MTLLLDSGMYTVIVTFYFVSYSKTRQTSGDPAVFDPGSQCGHAPMSFTEGQGPSAEESCQRQKAGENSSCMGQSASEVPQDEDDQAESRGGGVKPQASDMEISHKSEISLDIAAGDRQSDFVQVITTVKVLV